MAVKQQPLLVHRAISDAGAVVKKGNVDKRKLGTVSPSPPKVDVPNASAEGSCSNVSGPPAADLAVRLIVVGGRQVGKSALAVRYLTRRYIGEYQSFSGKYT